MGAKEFLADLRTSRRDLCDLVFHFTKPKYRTDSTGFDSKRVLDRTSFEVLRDILDSNTLQGGLGYIKGKQKCVCFSESPITELANLFSLLRKHNDTRYEPYGIAVRKLWLYSNGGRPVIYQPDSFGSSLVSSAECFHVRYEPDQYTDFSWEREWRIPVDSLKLDPTSALVVVPSAIEALELSASLKKSWMIVSLDLFGLGL